MAWNEDEAIRENVMPQADAPDESQEIILLRSLEDVTGMLVDWLDIIDSNYPKIKQEWNEEYWKAHQAAQAAQKVIG